jgi:hypothetical protein
VRRQEKLETSRSGEVPVKRVLAIAVLAASLLSTPARADSTEDALAALQQAFEQMKATYEAEIAGLKARVNDLESRQDTTEATADAANQAAQRAVRQAAAAPESAPPPRTSGSSSSFSNAFNPAIGVLFNGRYAHFQHDPSTYFVPGFTLPGEAGPGPDGFSINETEINLTANVNDLFLANTTVSISAGDGETEVDLEEAYIQTLNLPHGMTLRFGRFFPAIGYLNENHSHTDNFVDRPLPYQVFLNGQYKDDGAQLSIVLPTTLYVQLGAGYFRGGEFPAGGAVHGGRGAYTGFLRLGGDIGISSSWRAGVSMLHADASGLVTGEETADLFDPLTFDGNTDLLILDFKYEWAPNGNRIERYLVLQGEYIRRWQDGAFDGIPYSGTDDGFYIEGVYKFDRHWRAGYRFALLNPTDTLPVGLLGTTLDGMGFTPKNHTFMVDWARNEFSLVRFSFMHDASGLLVDNRLLLQYILSIGAHGAHNF